MTHCSRWCHCQHSSYIHTRDRLTFMNSYCIWLQMLLDFLTPNQAFFSQKNAKPFGEVHFHFHCLFSRNVAISNDVCWLSQYWTTRQEWLSTKLLHDDNKKASKCHILAQNENELHQMVSHFFAKRGLDSESGGQGASVVKCSGNSKS